MSTNQLKPYSGIDRAPGPISAPTPQSEIDREYSGLRDNIGGLGGLVDALFEKLEGVISNAPSATSGETGKGPECYSKFGQSISEDAAKLRRQCDRIHMLLHALAI